MAAVGEAGSTPKERSSSSNPAITVTSGLNGRLGCTYSASVGSWDSNDAYVPTSYTYQWTRSNNDISGATSSTYTTVAADAEATIGVKVKATNQRGSQKMKNIDKTISERDKKKQKS